MDTFTNTIQAKNTASLSPLEEMLKNYENSSLESSTQEEEFSQPMTQASFSMQSMVMAKNTASQNSLLQSVMAAASSNTAESSSERSAFGRQTAHNMLQGIEKDTFEQSFSNLLEDLRTDLEETVEAKLQEGTTGEDATLEEYIAAQEKTSADIAINSEENATTSSEGSVNTQEAQQVEVVTQTVPPAQQVAPSVTVNTAPAPSESDVAPAKEATPSLDVYV